ncbi:uncharacterized protein [Elaeis guineensis]|uniref:uncharacterized protein isoform X2 n=1 Tax=Elaeis guineensis var. tenera TaxID=51953 RepID=UPI003C6D40AB
MSCTNIPFLQEDEQMSGNHIRQVSQTMEGFSLLSLTNGGDSNMPDLKCYIKNIEGLQIQPFLVLHRRENQYLLYVFGGRYILQSLVPITLHFNLCIYQHVLELLKVGVNSLIRFRLLSKD